MSAIEVDDTTEISTNGLADTLDRIAEGCLKISNMSGVVGTPADKALTELYDVLNTEASYLRGDEEDEEDEDED